MSVAKRKTNYWPSASVKQARVLVRLTRNYAIQDHDITCGNDLPVNTQTHAAFVVIIIIAIITTASEHYDARICSICAVCLHTKLRVAKHEMCQLFICIAQTVRTTTDYLASGKCTKSYTEDSKQSWPSVPVPRSILAHRARLRILFTVNPLYKLLIFLRTYLFTCFRVLVNVYNLRICCTVSLVWAQWTVTVAGHCRLPARSIILYGVVNDTADVAVSLSGIEMLWRWCGDGNGFRGWHSIVSSGSNEARAWQRMQYVAKAAHGLPIHGDADKTSTTKPFRDKTLAARNVPTTQPEGVASYKRGCCLEGFVGGPSTM